MRGCRSDGKGRENVGIVVSMNRRKGWEDVNDSGIILKVVVMS